jgi:hypothetical protein
VGCETAVKLNAHAEKELLGNLSLKTSSCEKLITEKIVHMTYKVTKENQSLHNFETETEVQELNGINMGHILYSANILTSPNNITDEMRKNVAKKNRHQTVKFH